MSTQLTGREKTLVTIVGGVVLILVNLVLINFFITNYRRLHQDKITKTQQLEAMRSLIGEKDMWTKREAWIQAKQPRMSAEQTASREHKTEIEELAKKHNVLIKSSLVKKPERRPQCISVPLDLKVKSSQQDLVAFMRDVAGPEKFVVFESARIEIDQDDKTQMSGDFTVAKWYAPQ